MSSKIRVEQLINANGNPNANQFIIYDYENNRTLFQSYDSIVCQIKGGDVTFGSDWDYSRTTMKHLNTFLRDNGYSWLCGADKIRKAIKSGDALYDSNLS